MQNQGLGMHSEKIWTNITTYFADLPNWPKYLEYLKTIYFLVSVVSGSSHLISV